MSAFERPLTTKVPMLQCLHCVFSAPFHEVVPALFPAKKGFAWKCTSCGKSSYFEAMVSGIATRPEMFREVPMPGLDFSTSLFKAEKPLSWLDVEIKMEELSLGDGAPELGGAGVPPVNSGPVGPSSNVDIPGLLDVAVKEYSNWLQSRYDDEGLKAEVRKARDVALDDGLDLEQIDDDKDPEYFRQRGVKWGIARRFVMDIRYWVDNFKCNVDEGASIH